MYLASGRVEGPFVRFHAGPMQGDLLGVKPELGEEQRLFEQQDVLGQVREQIQGEKLMREDDAEFRHALNRDFELCFGGSVRSSISSRT